MKKRLLFILLIATANMALAQNEAPPKLPPIPGIDEGQFAVFNQRSFLVAAGLAAGSYLLAELAFDDENLNFYQVHAGYFAMNRDYNLFMENFGIEKRLAPWYGISLELVNQQWTSPGYNGMGMGLNGYYRWYLFGGKRLAPFIEAGTGLFFGFQKFPENSSQFTFNLTTALGLEYTFSNQNRFRVNYGHIHHSNNGLMPVNRGSIGNGFTATYLWFWKASKW
ncbi:acyloxyacyl hydrolase [Pontibacter sp. G13]|uniref:acyloxyacyl hydrolase n=1 Tax=Pontibacter sp. G13 TaxID=3074898 RepID=UPI00288BA29F|nr:acyloxyacyl hydrolase [Pontibacter sp. G13]WNJ20220.1 acyloxyacyl hydrolase [Pontibacter sp. G13]